MYDLLPSPAQHSALVQIRRCDGCISFRGIESNGIQRNTVKEVSIGLGGD